MKKITLEVNGIAAAKQYVPLVREIINIIPDHNIYIIGSSFHSEILLKELSFNNICAKISYVQKYKKDSLLVKLNYNNPIIYNPVENDKTIHFHIDPLKFESRRLLNEEEIGELKERYKVREKERVIFAGALHFSEFKNVLPAVKSHAYKNENSKAIIVPYTEGYLDDIARYVDFETNYSLKGNKKFLVIEEQGILDKLYSIGDVVLMGNTFKDNSYDGQNPLEPAFYGKQILSGVDYHLWNRDAYYGLLKSGLLRKVKVRDLEKELGRKVSEKYLNFVRKKAESFIHSKQGAAKVYAKIIKNFLDNKPSEFDKKYLSQKRTFDELRNYVNL